ncbi:MAG: polyphosphate kinase 2 [Mesorhizobium sp.]|nr:polyphosphate kinase 2 [Mesorhizobium sp.]
MKSVPAGSIEIEVDGKVRTFDIDDPKLAGWAERRHLSADGYPYKARLKRKEYEATLTALQIELVKLQYWLQATGERVLSIFEGRDAAGKGGTIFVLRQYMNPRSARNVALTKPTETERGQWYFQRHVAHFPTSGEFVTFDRSWYNRAGVEPVMGFCTPEENARFLTEVPGFERSITDDGIRFFKFWLNIGQETQLKRFHDRRHDPLKTWKFSPIDVAGLTRWDDYSRARDAMFRHTHTDHAPWTVIRANDKRRARLAAIRHILLSIPYEGRDLEVIGEQDETIISNDPTLIVGADAA